MWKITGTNLLLAIIFLVPSMAWSAQLEEKKRIHKIYEKHCVSCHGSKRGGGKASPLGTTGHAWHHADGQIFLWIKNGRYGPAMRMSGFGGTLTTEEICGLIAFIKKWWTPPQLESQKEVSLAFLVKNSCK